MRPGAGKSKGSDFEREVSKKLSLWITGGRNRDALWRSQSSGARATIAAGKGRKLDSQAGDIAAVHPDGLVFGKLFSVECKFYADVGYTEFITARTGPLMGFWAQAVRDSNKAGRHPLLVFKQNRRPIQAMTTVPLHLYATAPFNYGFFYPSNVYLYGFKELLQCVPFSAVAQGVKPRLQKR